jgi:hypothetical protein
MNINNESLLLTEKERFELKNCEMEKEIAFIGGHEL